MAEVFFFLLFSFMSLVTTCGWHVSVIKCVRCDMLPWMWGMPDGGPFDFLHPLSTDTRPQLLAPNHCWEATRVPQSRGELCSHPPSPSLSLGKVTEHWFWLWTKQVYLSSLVWTIWNPYVTRKYPVSNAIFCYDSKQMLRFAPLSSKRVSRFPERPI